MAETRFERELRDMLTIQLDAVHGPHPRWADAPAARRIGRLKAPASRRPALALVGVLAAAILVALAFTLSAVPKNVPVATQPATAQATIEPMPTTVSPSASPTTGEVRLGSVAVVTQDSAPALAVRVITLPSGSDSAVVRIDIRVVGPISTAVGVGNFGILHDGQRDPLEVSTSDPLAIPAGAPQGTTRSGEFTIPVTTREWADLAYYGTSTPAFTYPIHRPPLATELNPAACPTLADYAAASDIPSDAPMPTPSFDPVPSDVAITTGSIPLGTVGVLAGPDGHAGALVRVSNARFCDRLPDTRPDAFYWHLSPVDAPAVLLLADVDIEVLQDSTLPTFLPGGTSFVVAMTRGVYPLNPPVPYWLPGFNWHSSVDTAAGYRYRSTFAWVVPGGAYADGQISVGVFASNNPNGDPPAFSFFVRAGTVGRLPDATRPPATPLPSLTPPGGPWALDTPAVLSVGGVVAEITVGGVQQVPAYPAVAPAKPGDVFLEFACQSDSASADYTWNSSEWVVLGPDGSRASMLVRPSENTPFGWPNIAGLTGSTTIPHDLRMAIFQIAEVPATGRITLEYRPNGGPAVATWVLREQ